MNNVREIKIMTTRNQHLTWEQIEVKDTHREGDYWWNRIDLYVSMAKRFARAYDVQFVELRWNFKGSLQGHYIR